MRKSKRHAYQQQTRNRRSHKLLVAGIASFSLIGTGEALASQGLASTTWVGASDSWYNPSNWSAGTLPALTDDAFIDNGSTVSIADPNQTATANILSLGESTGFSGSLVVSDGTLTAVTDVRVGGNSNIPGVPGDTPTAGVGGGLGTLTQSGGVINVNGALNVGVGGATTVFGGSAGYYFMNGGVLNDGTTTSNFITVGNGSLVIGNVIQTAGIVNSAGSIIIGRNAGAGTWNLQGGTVSITNDLALGSVGAGTFLQSDGTVTLINVPVDNSGTTTYTTSNLNIGAGTTALPGTGLYQMTGGTLLVNRALGASTFVSSINSSIVVGNVGTGIFSQQGGFVQVANLIQLGRNNGVGTYAISNGTLAVGSMDIGNVGNGTLLQTGGAVSTTGSIIIGRSSQGIGTFIISGGSLSVGDAITVGGLNSGTSGNGMLSVGNVPVTVAGNMNIGLGGTSTLATTARGTGVLTAGTISFTGAAPIMAVGNGTGAFGSFTNNGGAVLNPNGLINIGRTTASGSFTNSGTVSCGSLVVQSGSSSFTNSGTVTTGLLRNDANTNSIVQTAGATTATSFNITGLLQFQAGTATLGSGTIGSGGVLRTSIPLSINAGSFGNATVQVDDPNATVSFGAINFPAARTLTKTGIGPMVINGAITYSSGGAGTITTLAGLTELNSNGTASLTLNANGGVTNLKTQETIKGLSIGAGGSVSLKASAGTTHSVTTFSIAGNTVPTGTLDIGSNHLVINYTGATPFANVKAQVISGFHNGDFNGPGIRSSSASFSGAHPTAIGYAEASAVGLTSSFNGVPTDSDTILLRYTSAGDANLSGTVDSNDFTRLSQNFNTIGAIWSQGDFNYDGTVNALDFNLLAANFGQTTAAPALGSLVPEPTTTAMLVAMLSMGLHRKRRPRI